MFRKQANITFLVCFACLSASIQMFSSLINKVFLCFSFFFPARNVIQTEIVGIPSRAVASLLKLKNM